MNLIDLKFSNKGKTKIKSYEDMKIRIYHVCLTQICERVKEICILRPR